MAQVYVSLGRLFTECKPRACYNENDFFFQSDIPLPFSFSLRLFREGRLSRGLDRSLAFSKRIIIVVWSGEKKVHRHISDTFLELISHRLINFFENFNYHTNWKSADKREAYDVECGERLFCKMNTHARMPIYGNR